MDSNYSSSCGSAGSLSGTSFIHSGSLQAWLMLATQASLLFIIWAAYYGAMTRSDVNASMANNTVTSKEDDTSSVQNQTDSSTIPSGVDSEAEKAKTKTKTKEKAKAQQAFGEYLKRWQLWSRTDEDWEPYDLDEASDDKVDGNFFFHIVERYKTRYNPPKTYLSNFSSILSDLLRVVVGGAFYNDPVVSPEDFLQYDATLHECLEVARRALSVESLQELDTSDREIMRKFGYGRDLEGDPAKMKDYLIEFVKQLDFLLNFIEEQSKPTLDRLKLAVSHGRISYDLLPFFFKLGTDIATTDLNDVKEESEKDNDSKQETQRPKSDNQPLAFVLRDARFSEMGNKPGDEAFYLFGYGWEWDGTEYTRCTIERYIPRFEGTKDITELPCQNMTPNMKEVLRERGVIYRSLTGIHYRSYRGNRVVIDRRAFDDRDGYTVNPHIPIPSIEDSDLHYLSPHVFGFNLGIKRTMRFIVTEIKEVDFDDDAWDHLVLEEKTKDMIKALVEVSRNSNSSNKIVSDVITGKGGGLIAVLHGNPGTGKTLTAEAVAELLKRPLYTIGASELSLEPEKMDKKLQGVLSLATAWDAVLLIDEADVFLAERKDDSLQRNTLVAIALRALEYHQGVLFLTTNRIRNFDDAFMSRFSITLTYPDLTERDRKIVWARFFKLAGCPPDGTDPRLPIDELFALAKEKFNGRMIKNIMRTAHTLAVARNVPLRIDHVKTVVDVQKKFMTDFHALRKNH